MVWPDCVIITGRLCPVIVSRAHYALLDVAARRDLVHHVQQRVLEHGAQTARAGLVADGFLGAGLEARRP